MGKYVDLNGLKYFLILFKKYMDPNYQPTEEEQKFIEEYKKIE